MAPSPHIILNATETRYGEFVPGVPTTAVLEADSHEPSSRLVDSWDGVQPESSALNFRLLHHCEGTFDGLDVAFRLLLLKLLLYLLPFL